MRVIHTISQFIFNKWHLLLAVVILSIGLALRLYNLNYNTPFNDEAIYVVVGRLGIFQWDWWSYNASAWMAGYPYVYPPLTALAYTTGGMVGSRLMNVIFGVLTAEAIFFITLHFAHKQMKYVAALIAMTIVLVSSVTLYVSRLATYDMPSFYFLFLGLAIYLKAEDQKQKGMLYFLSAVALIFAFFCKVVVGIYFPFILLYTLIRAHQIGGRQLFYWKRYFLVPILIIFAIYFFTNLHSLFAYATVQAAREKASFESILQIIFDNTTYMWILWAIGCLGLLIKNDLRVFVAFNSMAFLILVAHLISHRPQTLDKHTYLTVAFFAPLIGIGLSNLISEFHYKYLQVLGIGIIAIVLLCYGFISYKEAHRYNVLWDNADPLLAYLPTQIHQGDKVLVEIGAAGILALYEKDFPTNVTTFDWFEYHKLQGDEAFKRAVSEGYFDYIELEREDRPEDGGHAHLHLVIKNSLGNIYTPIFNQKGFVVYKRAI